MKGRRVVVTGLGIVSPIGNDKETAWRNLTSGVSGVGTITKFDPKGQSCTIAGEVKGFADAPEFDPRFARRADIFIRYAVAASSEALSDAGLKDGGFDKERAGTVIGSGIGGEPMIEVAHSLLVDKGPRYVSPFHVPSVIVNMAAGWVSMLFGLKGPNLAIATACTTGTHCVGEGARKIAYGDADVVLAGGTEGCVSPLTVAAFASSRALSVRNDEPERGSRPFDKGRDGFVLSEGAGVLVLEEEGHAKARGANVYCEVAGYGTSGDAHHVTAPPEDGAGAYLAMANAVADSGLALGDFDHINAHGTSTPLGDKAETLAIHRLFGARAPGIAVSGTKSMTGHLLGAAGGVESVFAALSVARAAAPPTINIDEPDPDCDLDYVAGTKARGLAIGAALSNSFGFGGTNASVAFKKH